jgi:hypothetical protein
VSRRTRSLWAVLPAVAVVLGLPTAAVAAPSATVVADDFAHHRAAIITGAQSAALQSAPIPGMRRIGVVLFDFAGHQTVQPYTAGDVLAAAFTGPDSLRAWYDEVSHGTMHLIGATTADGIGDTYGPVLIAGTAGACTTADINRWFAAAPTAAHVDLSRYDELLMLMPHQAACPWAGIAQTPGKLVVLNGGIALRVTAHETGHTLGLMHAGTIDCTTGPLTGSCAEDDYGDPYDAMGASPTSVFHFSSFHLLEAGFARPAQALSVTRTGGFALAPSDSTNGVTMIRIPRTTTSPLANRSGLCLEYRQPSGHFDAFAVSDNVIKGVLVRLCSTPTPAGAKSLPVSAAPTRLLNMHPGSVVAHYELDAGEVFADTAGGVSLRVDLPTAAGVTVAVALHGATLPPTPPTNAQVALSDATTHWAANVTWDASADATTTGYHLYRDGVLIATLPGSATSYPDGVVEPGLTRTFSVAAFDAAGDDSGPSTAAIDGPALSAAPDAPTGLGAVLSGKTMATVSWQAAAGGVAADHFDVMVDGQVTTSTTLTHIAITRKPGATAVVRIRAATAAGRPSPFTAPLKISFPAAGAPVVAITKLGIRSDFRTLRITFTARDPDGLKSIQILLDRRVIAKPKKGGTIQVTLRRALKHGRHTLQITATDRYGARASRSYAYLF